MKGFIKHLAFFLLLSSTALVLSSCDDAVEAVRTDGKAFTLYGYLNPKADTQAVRVFPIDEILEAEDRDQVDGLMTSTNLETGSKVTWRDSLVTYLDNNQGHVFYSPSRVEFDTPYEVNILRSSDGAITKATTQTPPLVDDSIEIVRDTGTDIEARVLWKDAPRLQNVKVRYKMLVELLGEIIDTFFLVDYVAEEVVAGSDWQISLQLDDDARQIFRTLNRPQGSRLTLCEVNIEALVTNREWNPPNGDYDPDVLVQPGIFSNVENGFGFVGSGYNQTTVWLPDSTQIRGAGFQYDPRCYNRN